MGWPGRGGLSGRQQKPRTEELNYDKHDKSANRKKKCFHAEGPVQAWGLPDATNSSAHSKSSKTGVAGER